MGWNLEGSAPAACAAGLFILVLVILWIYSTVDHSFCSPTALSQSHAPFDSITFLRELSTHLEDHVALVRALRPVDPAVVGVAAGSGLGGHVHLGHSPPADKK